MACNIPSHNLKEVVEALKLVVKKGNSVKTADIMKCIKGPDYKYGGRILSSEKEIEEVYAHGQGSIRYEYDEQGRLVHYKASNGSEDWYDSKGNIIRRKHSTGYVYCAEYDSNGNRINSKYLKET